MSTDKRKAQLGTLFLVILVDLIGFGMIIPILPYLAKTLGAGGWEIGALATSYSFMQFLFSPFWGRLSDRMGRRPVLLISIAGTSLALFGHAFANTLPLLFFCRMT